MRLAMLQAGKEKRDKELMRSNDPYGILRSENAEMLKLQQELSGSFTDWYKQQRTEQTRALEEFQEYLHEISLTFDDLADPEPEVDPFTPLNDSAKEAVTRIKEINAELKRLRKIDPESDEELDRIR